MRSKVFGRGRSLRYAIAFSCQLAFILFGYDQGVFSGIIGNQDFLEKMGHPGDTLTGVIVATYNLGAFTGCIINFSLGDWLGRRRAMWFAMVWIIVGATLQTSAFTIGHMVVGRFIAGIGTGIETSTVPMYQAELAEPQKRGKLVCSEPLFVGVGIVVSYFFDLGMSYVAAPVGVSWRLPIACQMVFALMVIAFVFGLPESPRYLYQKGRHDEALEILCEVYDRPREDPQIQREQADILGAIDLERKHGEYKWRNILKRDQVQTGYRILLSWGIQFINQMGGINLVVYYVPTALEQNIGLPHTEALIIGGCIQIMFILGSFYPTFFSDRVGRRKPMLWGSFGLALSMMLIAVLLSFQGTSIQKQTSSAAITFFFTYMLIFGASVNCIPWVYVPEILPLHARAKGTAIGISSNWIWNFFVVLISPIILNRLAWKAYLIFMCTNATFIPLVYFCYPETANLSLEEIDYIFTDAHTLREEVRLSKEMSKRKTMAGRGNGGDDGCGRRPSLTPGGGGGFSSGIHSRRDTLVGGKDLIEDQKHNAIEDENEKAVTGISAGYEETVRQE